MRIGLVTDVVYPYVKGGVERRVYEVSRRLAARGHDVHVFCMQYWDGGALLDLEGVKLHGVCPAIPIHTGERRSITEALYFSAHLFRYLSRLPWRVDVLEVQEFPYFPILAAKLSRWSKRRVPLVVTWHEVWNSYWFTYLGWKGIFGLAVERLAAAVGDRTVAVSQPVAVALKGLNPLARPVVIPNGVDVEAIRGCEAHSQKTDVIFIGRLLPHKRVDLLLQSLAQLNKNGSGVSCTIIGDGPSRQALGELSQALRLGDRVQWLPRLPQEDLYARLKASRVLALPSEREGFGLVVAEANAAGIPAVVVNHGMNAACSLVSPGENGFLCQPTPEDLAAAIENALHAGPALKAACEEAAHRLSWDGITDQLDDLYGRVGSGAGRDPESRPGR